MNETAERATRPAVFSASEQFPEVDMSTDPKDRQAGSGQRNEGEGNKTAARHYNEATTEFAKSGDVDAKAKEARKAVENDDSGKLRKAEREGLSKARH